MTELDQVWSQMLETAAARAEGSGQTEIARYIRLKAANDAIRNRGVSWLFDTMIEIVGKADRSNSGINIEREDPHSFQIGNSRMVGSALMVRLGVRCMTIEAGWTRTPNDGVMRGGALAAARIRHFGMKAQDANLVLAYSGQLPLWNFQNDEGERSEIHTDDLERHFQKLFDS